MNINDQNYELYLFRYAEGLLTADERNEVEAFLQQRPEMQELLSLYDPDLKIEAYGRDKVVFPHKENLKHNHIILLPTYAKIAVAASIALLLAVGTFFLTRNTKKTDNQVVATATTPTDSQSVVPADEQPSETAVPPTRNTVKPIHYATATLAITPQPTAPTTEPASTESALVAEESQQPATVVSEQPAEEPVATPKAITFYAERVSAGQNDEYFKSYSAQDNGIVSASGDKDIYDGVEKVTQSIAIRIKERIKGFFKQEKPKQQPEKEPDISENTDKPKTKSNPTI